MKRLWLIAVVCVGCSVQVRVRPQGPVSPAGQACVASCQERYGERWDVLDCVEDCPGFVKETGRCSPNVSEDPNQMCVEASEKQVPGELWAVGAALLAAVLVLVAIG